MNVLYMENLALGQDINECLVHGVLTLGQDINECLVHGELDLRTGHKLVSCTWRTCPEDST